MKLQREEVMIWESFRDNKSNVLKQENYPGQTKVLAYSQIQTLDSNIGLPSTQPPHRAQRRRRREH